jgi:hypothetical protein
MKHTIIILLSLIAIAAGIGCAALSEYITPARLEHRAIQYAIKAKTAEPNDYAGYQNLEKAVRLKTAVQAAHVGNQLFYSQLLEKDSVDYNLIDQQVDMSIQIGRQREELLFGETGILALGLSMAGAGGLAGYLGLMRKRPQDWSPEEVEKIKQDLKIKVGEKEGQFVELVRLIQEFRTADSKANGVGKEKLDTILDKMLTTTKLAVKDAKIKNNIT